MGWFKRKKETNYMDKNYEIEYLRLENEKLKRQLEQQGQQVDINQVKLIINLASEMREILELCRKEQINITVAKKIDRVLSRAKDFD